MAEDGLHRLLGVQTIIRYSPCSPPGGRVSSHDRPANRIARSQSGGLVAQSAVAPPGPIPNPVVTHRSAGEYCGVAPREARPLRAPPIGSFRRCETCQEMKPDVQIARPVFVVSNSYVSRPKQRGMRDGSDQRTLTRVLLQTEAGIAGDHDGLKPRGYALEVPVGLRPHHL